MVLKTGMNIEETRLQSGENIQRLLALSAPVAIKLLEMNYKGRNNPDLPAQSCMTKAEVEAVKIIAIRQTGKKPKKLTIGEAVKIIGFLGGWSGQKKDGPPGVRTLWKGWLQVSFLAQLIGDKLL